MGIQSSKFKALSAFRQQKLVYEYRIFYGRYWIRSLRILPLVILWVNENSSIGRYVVDPKMHIDNENSQVWY